MESSYENLHVFTITMTDEELSEIQKEYIDFTLFLENTDLTNWKTLVDVLEHFTS